jgi:hypothetical protein
MTVEKKKNKPNHKKSNTKIFFLMRCKFKVFTIKIFYGLVSANML